MNKTSYEKFLQTNTRPSVDKLTTEELAKIIVHFEPDFDTTNLSRIDFVKKIFDLWNNQELFDSNSNNIECLICYDNLTQGNNLTLCCGHKFHSTCLIKTAVYKTAYTFDVCIGDTENNTNKIIIDCQCPQCNTSIDQFTFFKPIIKKTNE